MKTRRELVTAALEEIRVLSIGETASSEDYARVQDAYEAIHAELRDQGTIYWPNTGNDTAEIPTAVFRALVAVLADDISGAYGKESATIDGQSARLEGLRRLRQHIAKRPSGESTPFSSY